MVPDILHEEVGLAPQAGDTGTPYRVFKHSGQYMPVMFVVDNDGEVSGTVVFEQSTDDGDSDAYAAVTLRVAGANVASVTVPAGRRVVGFIEGFEPAVTGIEAYFRVRETAGASVRVCLVNPTGKFEYFRDGRA